MNNDIFDKEITDVTLRGEDIRGAVHNLLFNHTLIWTTDKEYRVNDESAVIYNVLINHRDSKETSDDKAKFPSIKIMGQVRYRDLKGTKFVVLDESELGKASVSVADKARALADYLVAFSEHSAIEKLRSQIEDKSSGEELIIIASVELIPNSATFGQWPAKCNCGSNANPHVAVGENTDPFNVKPW